MENHERDLLKLLLDAGALKFGQFTLKSGRDSPYFVNLGTLSTGERLAQAGEAYARAIHDAFGLDFDVVFGPAYKAISLAVVTCEALWRLYGANVGFASDRKEAKDHGEGGVVFGSEMKAGTRIVFVDDVISAGTSLRGSLRLLREHFGARIVGSLVAVDRQERGTRRLVSAVKEIESEFGIPVRAILRMRDVVEELHGKPFEGNVYIDRRLRDDFIAYQRRYGAD